MRLALLLSLAAGLLQEHDASEASEVHGGIQPRHALLPLLIPALLPADAFQLPSAAVKPVQRAAPRVFAPRTLVDIEPLNHVLEASTDPVRPATRRWRPLRAPPAQMNEEVADVQRELERLRQLNGITADLPSTEEPMVLSSPLQYAAGSYPAIALSLPELSTPRQKALQLAGDPSARGVTLDFILDTAANTNTISAQIAGATAQGGLGLDVVGRVPAGVGASGGFDGGVTYALGNVELADVPSDERVVFMTGLTATALPIAAPAAAGLLGIAFLNAFPGGVDFRWGADSEPPSVSFYGDDKILRGIEATKALNRATIKPLPASLLPSVQLTINGVQVPALLDTGSPITVLNAAAAAKVGLTSKGKERAPTPLGRLAQKFQEAKEAASGEVLLINGPNGPSELVRTEIGVPMSLEGADFGDTRPYVGSLPGLAALNGLGAGAGPAAVLGLDVLRRRPRLLYTPTAVFL